VAVLTVDISLLQGVFRLAGSASKVKKLKVSCVFVFGNFVTFKHFGSCLLGMHVAKLSCYFERLQTHLTMVSNSLFL